MYGYFVYSNVIFKINVIEESPPLWDIINPDYATYIATKYCLIDIIDINKKSINFYNNKYININLDGQYISKIYKINEIYNETVYYSKNFNNVYNNMILMCFRMGLNIPFQFSGMHYAYHNNGRIAYEFYHNNFIKQGPYKIYNEDGILINEYNYINDQRL